MEFSKLIEMAVKHAGGEFESDENILSDEIRIILPSGCFLCYAHDFEYVRFTTPNEYEIMFWASEEWEEDGKSCMGAILGLANVLSNLKPEEIKELESQIDRVLYS